MAEKKTAMTTGRSELPLTHLTTGMGEEPGVRLRIHLLSTVAVIASGGLLWRILVPALRAGPGVIFFPKILISYRGDQKDGVFSPFLNTGDVKDAVTPHTAPHRLCSLH